MATAKKTTKTTKTTTGGGAAASTGTGTAVAVKKSSAIAVANLKEALQKQVADNAGRIAPGSGKSIRVGQDKSFTLPDGTKTRDDLELVVVDFVSRNEWYDRPFNKEDMTPPACFAIHTNPKELTPSDNSPIKQNDDCASCPMNAFGSSPTGSGKACSNGRLLAVLPPDADADTDIWTLKVSPTALKEFDGFVANVARTMGVPPVGVIVTVGFNETRDYPSLTFKDARPNENIGEHFARQDEAREMLMQEPDTSTFAPAETRKAATPARKPMARPRAAAR